MPVRTLAVVLVVLLIPAASAQSLDAAMGWLAERDAASPYVLEAVAAADENAAWWPDPGNGVLDRVHVPPISDDPIDPLREIHAVVASGFDPRDFQGRDLVVDLRANVAGALEGHDAAQTWQILAMHAAGIAGDDGDMQALADALLARQRRTGAWGCGAHAAPDCIGAALVALRVTGRLDASVADAADGWLASVKNPDGGYPLIEGGASSTQSTAWAITAYRVMDRADELGPDTWAFLAGQQRPDGSFACWPDGTPCDPLTATSEVAVVLADGWPMRAFQDVSFTIDERGSGRYVHVDSPWTERFWTLEGPVAGEPYFVPSGQPFAFHAAGDGAHRWFAEPVSSTAIQTEAASFMGPVAAAVALVGVMLVRRR